MVLITIDNDDFTSLFTPWIEKICQTMETVFYRLLQKLEFRQNYFAAHHIFNSLLGVWLNTVSRL